MAKKKRQKEKKKDFIWVIGWILLSLVALIFLGVTIYLWIS